MAVTIDFGFRCSSAEKYKQPDSLIAQRSGDGFALSVAMFTTVW
jgi:hypothetical protein